MKGRAYTWKLKLSILEELDVDGTSLKSVARKHDLSPKCLRRWRQQRVGAMTTASILCDSTSRHQFLNHRSLHPGRKPNTIDDTLGIILKMYRDLREQYRVVTLNLLATELKRLDPGPRNVTMPALCRHINRHNIKFGVVRRSASSVAQNTPDAMTVKTGYVAFVNKERLESIVPVILSILMRQISILTWSVGQHWLDVVIAPLHVPLLVALPGELFCWVLRWMERSSPHLSFSREPTHLVTRS
jgi:hypothetical protein